MSTNLHDIVKNTIRKEMTAFMKSNLRSFPRKIMIKKVQTKKDMKDAKLLFLVHVRGKILTSNH